MMKNQQKYENLTYLALWSLLFIAPVLSIYLRTATDTGMVFSWDEVLIVWRKLLFFLMALITSSAKGLNFFMRSLYFILYLISHCFSKVINKLIINPASYTIVFSLYLITM